MKDKIEEFQYTPQKDNQAVIGILEGPCADITDPTRNGRFYSEQLWEKVFNSDLVKEMLANGGIFGESQHPADRTEIDTEKIAIAMKEPPVKKNGQLFGKFYILNTPCGKILKTLADFGYKIGISSRGSGDTYLDEDGHETVDPDSYQFTCFDAVLIPAMKAARMNYTPITESLGGKTLKKALQESLETCTEPEKKVMLETLQSMNITLNENTTNSGVYNIEADSSNSMAADNFGAEVAKDLQRALKENKDLSRQLKDLQERLSVCYTKESKNEAEVADTKSQIGKLTEDLNSKKSVISSLNEQLRLRDALISQFRESSNSNKEQVNQLSESLNAAKVQVRNLTDKVSDLTEQLNNSEKLRLQEQKSLRENLQEMSKDSAIKKSEFTSKFNRQQELIEKYKSMAKTAVEKYIKSQAVLLGVSPEEIKGRLSESYSFNDIDRVCESLKNYKLNVSSLPFNNAGKRPSKVCFSESVKPANVIQQRPSIDDEPDEQLLGLANFMGR